MAESMHQKKQPLQAAFILQANCSCLYLKFNIYSELVKPRSILPSLVKLTLLERQVQLNMFPFEYPSAFFMLFSDYELELLSVGKFN